MKNNALILKDGLCSFVKLFQGVGITHKKRSRKTKVIVFQRYNGKNKYLPCIKCFAYFVFILASE